MTRSSWPFHSRTSSADLQTHALARLRRAAVERSADAVVFSRAKDPSDRFVEIAERLGLEPVGQHFHQQPARKMGRRFAAQMGAPLMAHPIEVEALEVADDRLKGSVKRQQSGRRWRHQLIRRPPGVGSRASHADYAASIAFRLGQRLSTAACCRTVRPPRYAGPSEIR